MVLMPPQMPAPYTNLINEVHNNNRLDQVPKGLEGGFVQDLRKMKALQPQPMVKAPGAPKIAALSAALKPKGRLPKLKKF